ncbi:MAG TPA: dihydrodipicolinate synthase family protein [Trebonia sp.]|nr:dihydrodipicolinate synthase family protein [Trebonia sp.]
MPADTGALEGVIVALVTPVDRAGRVDHGALGQLVQRLAGRGVAGISPLGSTGEGYSLGLDQRLAVVDTVARAVPAGMPVIPGVFPHNHEQAVAEIAAYADHGGTAVLAAPPAYYPMRADEQEAYFSRVADAAALPLVIYNIPVFTKVRIEPAVAAALAPHPRVAGLKDSGKDLLHTSALLDAVAAAGPAAAGFSVLTGTDTLLVASMLAGARGTICANANVVPELVVAVYDAVRAGKLDEAVRHEARLRAVQAAFDTGGLPAAYKAAVASTGVGERWLVPPRQPLTEAETDRLLARLTALEML